MVRTGTYKKLPQEQKDKINAERRAKYDANKGTVSEEERAQKNFDRRVDYKIDSFLKQATMARTNNGTPSTKVNGTPRKRRGSSMKKTLLQSPEGKNLVKVVEKVTSVYDTEAKARLLAEQASVTRSKDMGVLAKGLGNLLEQAASTPKSESGDSETSALDSASDEEVEVVAPPTVTRKSQRKSKGTTIGTDLVGDRINKARAINSKPGLTKEDKSEITRRVAASMPPPPKKSKTSTRKKKTT